MSIARDHYVDELMSRRENGFVKIITGIRRCGKSYLLNTLFRERLVKEGVQDSNIISIDLDDDEMRPLHDPIRLSEYVRQAVRSINARRKAASTCYIFIDEVQRCRKVLPDNIDLTRITPEDREDAAADLGLRNARLNFRDTDLSHPMENAIFNELVLRGCNVDVGVVPIATVKNGIKETRQHEIDFVVNRGNDRLYIQSALELNTASKRDQEKLSLKYTTFHKNWLIGIAQPGKKVINQSWYEFKARSQMNDIASAVHHTNRTLAKFSRSVHKTLRHQGMRLQ